MLDWLRRWFKRAPLEPGVMADRGSVAAGGGILNSPITIGLDEAGVRGAIQHATATITELQLNVEEHAKGRHFELSTITSRVETTTNKVDEATQRIESKLDEVIRRRGIPRGVAAIIEKRFSEALAMARKGAIDGDEVCKKAVELLDLGRRTEAEPVFLVIAEASALIMKKARIDAAIAYRNLGAIIGLRDPKRAIDAYKIALQFDPEDWESMFCIGSIQQDLGLSGVEAQFKRGLEPDGTEGYHDR
jgi:hypothetical protein